jgi:nucleoid-associated protein YgaU
MAKERLALCEKHVADELARKHKLIGDAAIAAEGERLRGEIKTLTDERDRASASLAASQESLAKLKSENDRLRKLLATMEGGGGEPSKPMDVAATVKDLLDDDGDDDGAKPVKVSAKDALGDDADVPSAATSLDDAKALNALAEAEEAGFGSSSGMLPGQAPDAKAQKKAAEDAQKKTKAEQAAKKDAIPDTYTVQEGDTLYKIAQRFYGRTSAWKRIREENKDKISTDGRVRTGQVLKLPK